MNPNACYARPFLSLNTLMSIRILLFIIALIATEVCAFDELNKSLPAEINFNRDIRPILFGNCVACHGPDESAREADLRLDQRDDALRDLGGHAAIVVNDIKASELIRRVTSDDDDMRMPPPSHGKQLNDKEVELLKRWIESGAPYDKHWSYVVPETPSLPNVSTTTTSTNPIDLYILSKLESLSLKPSLRADRRVLARRVALAITGLPPSVEEAEQFISDQQPDAYERYVEAQLNKPSYGEYWARDWLDLARYADSAGYADDPPRTIWAYRDYVIRAFNDNMPFDQFTIEQIAGDLLDSPTESQLVATAFHRNTMTNNEGGTNDEQFRNEAIVDRVNTTMAVWMGTTIACAQCHTHKYDPITQAEYFQLFDYFNQTEDADRRDESPFIELWSNSNDPVKRDELRQQLAKLESEFNETADPMKEAFDAWLQDHKANDELVGQLPEKLRALVKKESIDEREQRQLLDHFKSTTSLLSELRTNIAGTKDQLAKLEPITTVPVMRDLASDKKRKTFVQLRGNYQSLGEEVRAGVPAIFGTLPADAPKNRLTLAKWLVSRENPLTARVVVNRYWEKLFGTGLVETSEEFGSQGELPTHPELLDYLAVDFMEHGWDVKRLIKLMLMSSTYQQSSEVDAAALEADPQNRYYSRGPRFRLSAETIRDQSLAVAGLLSSKMYGPPVRPPQPELGLTAAFGSKTDWQTSQGEDRYRRGIYTTWRRSNPYPSMATFDAPNREVCTLRRSRTNTPLQALVTLNDPAFVEAAQALARKMAKESSLAAKIASGYRQALLREPTESETKTLSQLYLQVMEYYSSNSSEAKLMAQVPIGVIPESSTLDEVASLTVVANVILNLDEFLMPR